MMSMAMNLMGVAVRVIGVLAESRWWTFWPLGWATSPSRCLQGARWLSHCCWHRRCNFSCSRGKQVC